LVAPLPIKEALNILTNGWKVYFPIDDVQHIWTSFPGSPDWQERIADSNLTRVSWLPPTSWIKRGAIQNYGIILLVEFCYPGWKFLDITISLKKQFSHLNSSLDWII
jgi:hypothetical protein